MSRARAAIVTGGSRGIGLAIAQRLAAAGHALALVARDAAQLERACAQLRQYGVAVLALAVDLRTATAVDHIVRTVHAELGAPQILVNNAGTAPSDRIESTADAVLDEVLDLHVRAPFRLIRALLPQMKQTAGACIVQVASAAGLRGFPFTAAYGAAKHAMVGLTRALAEELRGSGVHVYAVCPGFVETDITQRAAAAIAARGRHSAAQALRMFARMNRIGRLLQPDEVAAAVAMLCEQLPEQSIHDLDEPDAAEERA